MVYYTGRVCLYNLEKYSFKSFALTLQGGAIMGKDIVTELGVIDISKDVIANLAGLATMECVGAVGVVSTRAFTDGLGELLGKLFGGGQQQQQQSAAANPLSSMMGSMMGGVDITSLLSGLLK